MTVQSLETPENEFELVSKVFFRGSELEREYDEEQYFIKSTNVAVYTMDDL
jgi:hypothetical protein